MRNKKWKSRPVNTLFKGERKEGKRDREHAVMGKKGKCKTEEIGDTWC